MYIPATLSIGINNTVGQCLYHALSSIYLTNVKIIADNPDNPDNDNENEKQTRKFKFVDGKVFFCTDSTVSSNQYNPDNIRFTPLTQPEPKTHLIIQDLKNETEFDTPQYYLYEWPDDVQNHTDGEDSDEDSDKDSDEDSDEDSDKDGDEDSDKEMAMFPPKLKKLWQQINGYTNNIRLDTQNSDIFRDFFETLLGISPFLNDLKTYLSEEKIDESGLQIDITTHIPKDLTVQLSNALEREFNNNEKVFPKSTVLPILLSGDLSGDLSHNTLKMDNTVTIAKLWYSKILTGIRYASTIRPFSSFGNISPQISDQPSLVDFIYEQTKIDSNEEDNYKKQKNAICMSFKQIYITDIGINVKTIDEKANATLEKIDKFREKTPEWNEETVKKLIEIIINTKFTN